MSECLFLFKLILRAGLERDIRLAENRDDDNPRIIIEKMYAAVHKDIINIYIRSRAINSCYKAF